MDAVLASLRLQVAALPEQDREAAWQKLVAQVAAELEGHDIRLPAADRPDHKPEPALLQAVAASLAGQHDPAALRAALSELASGKTVPELPNDAPDSAGGLPASLRAKLADEKTLQQQEHSQRETERAQAARETARAVREVSERLSPDVRLPAEPARARDLQRDEMEPARTQHIQKER